jgi:hypothetical protein
MPLGWAVTVVVLCVAVVVLTVVVLGMLRQVAPILERAAASQAGAALEFQGPPIGQQIPDFTVSGPEGEVTAEQLRGRSSVLLFLSVGCGPCEQLAAQLRDADPEDLPHLLIVVTGPEGPHGLNLPTRLQTVIEHEAEISHPLSVVGTPLAIAVDSEGIVTAVRVVNTLEQLTDTAATATGKTPHESAPRPA